VTRRRAPETVADLEGGEIVRLVTGILVRVAARRGDGRYVRLVVEDAGAWREASEPLWCDDRIGVREVVADRVQLYGERAARETNAEVDPLAAHEDPIDPLFAGRST
jgi:hypothetical protein